MTETTPLCSIPDRRKFPVNLVWEFTQALVAVSITFANIATSILMALNDKKVTDYPEVMKGAFYLIIGFYFSRTTSDGKMQLPMKAALVACLLFSFSMMAQSGGGVLPIGANENWKTDLWLRNLSGVSVTQNVGTLNMRMPDGSIRTIRTDVTLAPFETKRLSRVDLNFDSGLWILSIDERLESSAYLIFRDGSQTKFELNAIRSVFTRDADSYLYHRVATDFFGKVGTWLTVMNTGQNEILFEILVSGPVRDGSDVTRERYSAPPGVSQYGIKREIPYGGSLLACIGACGIGAPILYPPTYIFATTGPWDGGMQGIRYPEEP